MTPPERLQDVTLAERLLEMCREPDGTEMPDHAEPWGADVATLRKAAAALSVRGEPVAVGRVWITEAGFVHISSSVAELGNARAAGNGASVFAYATPPSEG